MLTCSKNDITLWLYGDSMNVLPPNDQMIEEIGRLFGALGDSSRLKILRVLLDSSKPLTQGAVAEATGLSQPNASKHLALLAQAGLVYREPQGSAVLFRAVKPVVQDVCGIVCRHVADRIHSVYASLD
jgi:DNA-binding transcriptional ArsR family regulator